MKITVNFAKTSFKLKGEQHSFVFICVKGEKFIPESFQL